VVAGEGEDVAGEDEDGGFVFGVVEVSAEFDGEVGLVEGAVAVGPQVGEGEAFHEVEAVAVDLFGGECQFEAVDLLFLGGGVGDRQAEDGREEDDLFHAGRFGGLWMWVR
jgi:hypothetical protein